MKPTQTKQKILNGIAITVFALALPCFAQSRLESADCVRDGERVDDMQLSVIQFLLAPDTDYLKKSLINFLETLDVSQISDATVKRILGDREHVEALRRDILESTYGLELAGDCSNSNQNARAFRSIVGRRGGLVLFNFRDILRSQSVVNADEITAALAAIAIREHHLQLREEVSGNTSGIEELEAEAKILTEYLRINFRVTRPRMLTPQQPRAFQPLRFLNVHLKT